MTLHLVINIGDGWLEAVPDLEKLAHEVTAATLAKAGLDHPAIEIGLAFGDDALLQALNRRHRGKDKPTNVLSFPLGFQNTPRDVPLLLGDVAISLDTVRREAACDGKTVRDHAVHLLVHGILHLLGRDHEQEGEAVAMEAEETQILSGFGVANPYIILT